MAESSGADSGPAEGIGCYVEDDIVGTRGIARDSADTGKMIKSEIVAYAPPDVVVGAGCVTADAYATNNYFARSIERQAATEYVDSPDLVAGHRVLRSADLLRRPRVGVRSIYWITVLQPV